MTREVVSLLHAGSDANETLDLSTYGFLYGTFPSAPTVFVFATQYNLDVDLIASAMVACTFLSAPLMFVSAKMITLTNMSPSKYIVELDNFAFDISIGSLIACCWILLVFLVTKKIRNVPHRMTAALVVSQVFSCVGVILWSTLGRTQNWTSYLQFAVLTVGVYSSRMFTAFLAVTLLFVQCRSLCFVLKMQPYFLVSGWGVPIVIMILLVLFDTQNVVPYEKRNPNFQYGIAQALISVCLLILCFIVTVGCLILHQRYRKRYNQYMTMANEVAAASNSETENLIADNDPGRNSLPTISEGCCEESSPVDIEDLVPSSPSRPTLCPTRFNCNPARSCQTLLKQYEERDVTEDEPETPDQQILRHTVLLILLLCSMFIGLSVSIWTLIMENVSGIYIEVAFLDAALNFGQGLIVFIIFGLDTKELLVPLSRYWRKLWYGANLLTLPKLEDLSTETKHICDQFVTHHLENCKRTIAKDTR